jgi:hypothetical protein
LEGGDLKAAFQETQKFGRDRKLYLIECN